MQDPPEEQLAPSRRIVATILIATAVGLQLLVTSRVLCPPKGLVPRSWPRIVCPPSLWPFVDYPMFSAPHPKGDTLAWVDARVVSASGDVTSSSAHEVQRISAEESWEQAFARAEQKLREEIEPALPAHALRLSRHKLLLAEQGLVPCEDCPEVRR